MYGWRNHHRDLREDRSAMPTLIITADDYGYAPSYDSGIAEAAAAGAIDAVSAMVTRYEPDPAPLVDSDVAIGLHLELERAPLEEQLASFERVFERGPAYLDGHHHCHARGAPAVAVADLARERGLRVRSVDARHRRLLRCKGVATPDRLVGRLSQADPALPEEVSALRRGSGPDGVTEWMTHPGRADPHDRSSYDAGRGEDLALLLALASDARLRAIRKRHAPPG
jgi:chitin disaccharide deacetylase